MGTLYLILASALWGLVHSWLASHLFKDAARRALGESFMRWHRLLYNVFAVISVLPVLFLSMILPDQKFYSVPAPFSFALNLVQALAAFALLIGVLQTGAWNFAGLYALTGVEPKPDNLITGGLYRFVRHPLYSAGLLFIWFSPSMTVNRFVLYAAFTVYILIGAVFEERKLLKDFGEEYARYRAKTPMLIPGLF